MRLGEAAWVEEEVVWVEWVEALEWTAMAWNSDHWCIGPPLLLEHQ